MVKSLSNDSLWHLGKWVLFLCALQSFRAWFFWGIPEILAQIFTFLVCSVLSIGRQQSNKTNMRWFIIYAIAFLLTIFTQGMPNFNGLVSIFLRLYPLFFMFLLKKEYKHDLYIVFRKGLGVLFAVSAFFWLLYLFGMSLPYSVVEYGKLDEGGYQYMFENHYLYLVNITALFYLFPRFSCVFLEPGYTGCMLSILLYLGRFKFSKEYWENMVFLIALLLTFSLAGWGLTALAAFFLIVHKSKKRFLWLLVASIAFGLFYFVVTTWNNGDNIVNLLIFDRLEFDASSGIVGNHRYSESVNDEFWYHFIYSDKLLFGGVDPADYSEFYNSSNEVSAVAYIMRYGFIAFVFLVGYFFYPIFFLKRERFAALALSLIFFLIFAQTIHMTHSFMYVTLLILCVNEISYLTYKTDKIDVNI